MKTYTLTEEEIKVVIKYAFLQGEKYSLEAEYPTEEEEEESALNDVEDVVFYKLGMS